MKTQLKGIALILFGILLALFALFDPWLPIIGRYAGDFANYASVVVGIIGLVLVFKKETAK